MYRYLCIYSQPFSFLCSSKSTRFTSIFPHHRSHFRAAFQQCQQCNCSRIIYATGCAIDLASYSICKKGELVQPQLFRATLHLSHTLLNHFHTMESPTPSPLRCAAPVHASPPIALPNPFINELQFARLAAPRIPQCTHFATRPSAVES